VVCIVQVIKRFVDRSYKY